MVLKEIHQVLVQVMTVIINVNREKYDLSWCDSISSFISRLALCLENTKTLERDDSLLLTLHIAHHEVSVLYTVLWLCRT